MSEFLEAMESWEGYVPASSIHVNQTSLVEALRLVRNERNLPHWRHQYAVQEAITTSDFPTLFGVLIQQDLIAKHQLVTADWRAYVRTGSLPNFNIHTKHKVYGQETVLPAIAEKGPYTATPSGTGHYHGNLTKYGRVFDISWESVINDSLGAFSDIGERFANAARHTLDFNVTDLFASAAGPDVGLYGTPIADVDGQNITNRGVLELTIANLQTTLRLMSAQTDPDGNRIQVRGVHLVAPPALEFTARAILTSATVIATAAAFPGVPEINITPQLGIQLHVNPFLNEVDTSGNTNGTWYMFAEPSQGVAVEMDFLAGQEAPEICMKNPNKVSLGGGAAGGVMSGDFDSDNIMYRVRCVHGGWRLDPRYTYAQVHA